MVVFFSVVAAFLITFFWRVSRRNWRLYQLKCEQVKCIDGKLSELKNEHADKLKHVHDQLMGVRADRDDLRKKYSALENAHRALYYERSKAAEAIKKLDRIFAICKGEGEFSVEKARDVLLQRRRMAGVPTVADRPIEDLQKEIEKEINSQPEDLDLQEYLKRNPIMKFAINPGGNPPAYDLLSIETEQLT